MKNIFLDYLVTFGWAIVGSVSMGIGLIIVLKIFDYSTGKLDEWAEIKNKNTAVAIILASLILACAWVVSSVIRP